MMTSKLNRRLAVCAIVGLLVTLAGTGMEAADITVGGVTRFFGMCALLVTGVVFVGKPFVDRKVKRFKENRAHKLRNRGITEPTSTTIYIVILVTACRVFGCLLMAIAAIQFCMTCFNLVAAGFPIRQNGFWYLLIQMLLAPIVTAGTGLLMLCVAEILRRVAILTITTPTTLQSMYRGTTVEPVTEIGIATDVESRSI